MPGTQPQGHTDTQIYAQSLMYKGQSHARIHRTNAHTHKTPQAGPQGHRGPSIRTQEIQRHLGTCVPAALWHRHIHGQIPRPHIGGRRRSCTQVVAPLIWRCLRGAPPIPLHTHTRYLGTPSREWTLAESPSRDPHTHNPINSPTHT